MKNHELFNELILLSTVNKTMFNKGLNNAQTKTIILIRQNKGNTMGEINNLIGIEKGSFTTLVDKLIEKGLVKRKRSDKDKRKISLVLTDKGIKTSNNYIALMDNNLDEKLKFFTEDYKKRILGSLKEINDFLEEVKNFEKNF